MAQSMAPINESPLTLLGEFAEKHGLKRSGQRWQRRMALKTESSVRIYSFTMESDFWLALEVISFREEKSADHIVSRIFERKQKGVSLASATKVFVISYLVNMHLNADEVLKIDDKIDYGLSQSITNFFGHLLYIIANREKLSLNETVERIKDRSKGQNCYQAVSSFCLQYMIGLITNDVITEYLLSKLVFQEMINDKNKTGHDLTIVH